MISIGAGSAWRRWPAACIGIVLALAVLPTSVPAGEPPTLLTNQNYVEELRRPGSVALDDPLQVFAFVLASLPARVTVYPTENYYYFKFVQDGHQIGGSIRLAKADRDQGKVHFGYYQVLTDWKSEFGLNKYEVLDAGRGVGVEQVEPLIYRVSYQGKAVLFALNDLSRIKPPAAALGPDEKFLGPILDESAIAFFFIYNARLKVFHFILDETERTGDELYPSASSPRILIGRRTGFAFYRDHLRDRKILIGAFEPNSRVNNYFDGPFDQLPENFIDGEALREAIIDADPGARGRIDRLGNFTAEEGRYLIHPYMLYRRESDLGRIDRCAQAREKRADYYRCFVVDPDGQIERTPAPARKR
jgi:hypothetical protein